MTKALFVPGFQAMVGLATQKVSTLQNHLATCNADIGSHVLPQE